MGSDLRGVCERPCVHVTSTPRNHTRCTSRRGAPCLALRQDQSRVGRGRGRGRGRAGEEAPEAPHLWPERTCGGAPWARPAFSGGHPSVWTPPHASAPMACSRKGGRQGWNPGATTCARSPSEAGEVSGDVNRGPGEPAAVATALPRDPRAPMAWRSPGQRGGSTLRSYAPPPLVRTAESGGEQAPER